MKYINKITWIEEMTFDFIMYLMIFRSEHKDI